MGMVYVKDELEGYVNRINHEYERSNAQQKRAIVQSEESFGNWLEEVCSDIWDGIKSISNGVKKIWDWFIGLF